MKPLKIIGLMSALLLMTFIINAQYKPDSADEAALKVYTKRIESNPKDFDAYFERGKLYRLMRGKTDKETSDFLDKAIKDFTKAVEIDPSLNKAYLERAKSYGFNSELGEKDITKAVSLIREAQDKTGTGTRKYSEDELNYCPALNNGDYTSICNEMTFKSVAHEKYIDKFNYAFDEKLWNMSCAFPDHYSLEEAIPKVRRLWDKNKQNFTCAALGFSISEGSVLKFAFNENFSTFVETIVENYDLDINFKDKDGKNVLDFINDEIKRRTSSNPDSTKQVKKYKELLILLGANPSR